MNNNIHALHYPKLPIHKPTQTNRTESNFQEILQHNERLQLSKHAKERMAERNIYLAKNTLRLMEAKIDEAAKKGVEDSLVLTKDAAFIVSVKNKLVITAMEKSELQSKIFTGINGTIILED